MGRVDNVVLWAWVILAGWALAACGDDPSPQESPPVAAPAPVDAGNPSPVDPADAVSDGASGSTPAGASCSDGDPCNGEEIRDEVGNCVAGTAPVVEDGNPCTDDLCDPASGLVHTPTPRETPCSDGDACNGEETCDGAGTCAAGAPPTVDDGNPCTLDRCEPAAGVVHAPASTGTSCSDGDACNGEEACDGAGLCAAGVPPGMMDDGNPCTIDRCEPAAGVVHAPAPAGTPCSDGDACNGEEACDGASRCAAGAPLAIDDGDPCTLDACEPSSGITRAPCEALDRTVATALVDATRFLYTGSNPVQIGVAPGTIEPRRAAVIRGQVRATDGAPLAGISVAVQGHPEYGGTKTLADGTFWMAVNGGGALLVTYQGDGYLRVARQVEVPWQDYAVAGEVVMTPYDSRVTVVDLAAPAPISVARGSVAGSNRLGGRVA
jgi:hypothetical protein